MLKRPHFFRNRPSALLARLVLGLVFVPAASTVPTSSATAADIGVYDVLPAGLPAQGKCTDGYCEPRRGLYLRGPIKRGDYEKFLKALLQLNRGDATCQLLPKPDGNCFFTNVFLTLSSEGGSFNEALKIADAITLHTIETIVLKDTACMSACAIAFMAGRSAFNSPNFTYVQRTMHTTSRLGFHSPFIVANRDLQYSGDDIESRYEAALRDMSQLFRPDFPRRLIKQMLAVGSRDFYKIDRVHKLLAFDIGIFGRFKGSRKPFKYDLDVRSTDQFSKAQISEMCMNALFIVTHDRTDDQVRTEYDEAFGPKGFYREVFEVNDDYVMSKSPDKLVVDFGGIEGLLCVIGRDKELKTNFVEILEGDDSLKKVYLNGLHLMNGATKIGG
ncbi:MAG: hypothetical protein AAGJ70_09035 [Pseudomonadota bacterium]